jgi:sugar O-acyltransferase (sialic acid O-acetyltransferase NeuD family)
MKKIAIIGAGGFGREIKMLIDQINAAENKYEFIGYFDDNQSIGPFVNGFPILGTIDAINKVSDELCVSIALGNPIYKKRAVERISNQNIIFETLIHPNVLMGNDTISIGKGAIICAGSILTCDISIHDFVTINLACTIGHDTIIENYSSLMPGINVSGEVILRTGVYVGTGATIINQIEIEENTVVGAGAVVSKSLPKNCTAVGIPAQPIKFHE